MDTSNRRPIKTRSVAWAGAFARVLAKSGFTPNRVSVIGVVMALLGAAAMVSARNHPSAGAALWWITPFNPWQAALMALAICVMGFFGGLVMSAIKRDRGVKDFGAMIEGHGGMLDRIDSLCFAAPLFFHLVRYFFAGG